MTVDPGVGGTGLAYWGVQRSTPTHTACIRPYHKKSVWTSRALEVAEQYRRYITLWAPMDIYIEEPSLWMSAKGLASANRKDLLKLTQLIGMLILSTEQMLGPRRTPRLISVQKWKGQLPKHIVTRRVERKTGIVYPDHVSDAVGMGLYVLGML